ncbi:MAG: glycosyltransferase [Elusimicrobia bacterium]|nr:glycosyltransferase [Elusimicrobiota bacterium]
MSKPRLSVYHLDGERGLRGGERQLLYLACRLRCLGHENVVVCRRDSPVSREASALGLERFHLPFIGEWDPISAWRLRRRALLSANPILHAHTAHSAALASLAALWGRLPWLAHRRVDFHLSGGLSRRMKYEAAGRVVAVSEGVRRVLIEDGLPAGRVAVVRDCVPIGAEEARAVGLAEPYAPASANERQSLRAKLAGEWSLPAGAPWVGSAAAFVPHKDPETLLRAAALVLAERKDARFILLGEGQLRQALEALASSLGIRGEVIFAGWRSDIVRCLKAFDLLAHSPWGEGLGSVLLEAMACGLPVVATTAGGIPEVVEDGRTGLLSPPRSPQALAERILQTLSDPARAAERACSALAAARGFSLAAAGEKMENLYLELASSKT